MVNLENLRTHRWLLKSIAIIGTFFLGIVLGYIHRAPALAASQSVADLQLPAQTILSRQMWVGHPRLMGHFRNPDDYQVLVLPTGAIHLVWEDEGWIYHAWQDVTGTWHAPRPVFYGITPSLAFDKGGVVHMVFVAHVVDNYEIYYSYFDGQRWSWPRPISFTPGASYSPQVAVAVSEAGELHVVWNDASQGRDTVYHAILDREHNVWLNAPLPNARGKAPIIHIDPQGLFHVIWQGVDAEGVTNIFYEYGDGKNWSLPFNVSHTNNPSINAQSVLDRRGDVHIVWREMTYTGGAMYYTFGRKTHWLRPEVTTTRTVEHVGIATSERGTFIHVWWYDASSWWERWRPLTSLEWSSAYSLTDHSASLVHIRFATENDTRLRALWKLHTGEDTEIWYSEAITPVRQRVHMPLVFHGASSTRTRCPAPTPPH